VTRGQLAQRAGLPGLNGGGTEEIYIHVLVLMLTLTSDTEFYGKNGLN